MSTWAGAGPAYAASYAELCAGTVERMREIAGPARGRSLLDVGAGEGTPASAWIAAGWDVVACEPEASMRAQAARKHPSLPMIDASLPALPLGGGSFDVVTANFVLNHVPDPRAAAAELARVSRAHVIATIWTASPSWFWAEVVERAELEPATGGRLPQELDFDRTAAGFVRMLAEAGLPGAVVVEQSWTWKVTPATLWTAVEGGVAGMGAFYRDLSSADRSAFRAAFDAVVADREQQGRLPLDHRAALASWTRDDAAPAA
ncbi:class I SAM-dependent methyltransferase [Microbacterium sp. NPDC055903]